MKTEPQDISLPNITLRDFFAGLAMAAMVGNFYRVENDSEQEIESEGDVIKTSSGVSSSEPWTPTLIENAESRFEVADAAYEIADAMMERREDDDHEETV